MSSAFWEENHIDYTDAFINAQVKIILIYACPFLIISILINIAFLIRLYLNRKYQRQFSKVPQKEQQQQQIIQLTTWKQRLLTIAEIVNILCLYIAALWVSMMFPILSGFDKITTDVSIITILTILIVAQLHQILKYQQSETDARFFIRVTTYIRKNWILHSIILALILAYGITMPLVTSKLCLCTYNPKYSYDLFDGFGISSEVTRSYDIPDNVCELEQICHVYATLPSDTDSSVFINVHTGKDVQDLYIVMSVGSDTHQFNCDQFAMPSGIDTNGQRNIYSCLAQNLISQTTYNLIVKSRYLDTIEYRSTYKTLPSRDQQNFEQLTLVFGGDVGHLEESKIIISDISDLQPSAILIGGDQAYDNGQKHCYYSQDAFIGMFENEFKEINRIIPFIFAIGNHEVGYASLNKVNITAGNNTSPYHFTMYPQHYGEVSGVPKIEERKSYTYHKIGNLLIFSIDSGYVETYQEQSEWMKHIIDQHPNYKYIAQYHNPIYPSCIYRMDQLTLTEEQLSWTSVFDQYQFIAAFENHLHQFKKTFPIRNGEIATQGTIYFGDGAMGPYVNHCDTPEMGEHLFEIRRNGNGQHKWVINILQDQTITFTAYDLQMEFIENSYHIHVHNEL